MNKTTRERVAEMRQGNDLLTQTECRQALKKLGWCVSRQIISQVWDEPEAAPVGAPCVLTDDLVKEAMERHKHGKTYVEIAAEWGVAVSTLYNRVSQYRRES